MFFINPYNFVPLAEEAPSQANNEEGDYTGYIEYDLYTRTPLFIPNTSNSDTFNVPGKVEGHKSFEFFSYMDLTGQTLKMEDSGPEDPVIPGSEIRGMFRSYYEILTNSCLSVVDEDKDVVLSKRTNEVFSAGLIRKDSDGKYSLFKAEDCLLRTMGANSLVDKIPFNGRDDWRNKSFIQAALHEGTRVKFKKSNRGGRIKPLALCVNNPSATNIGYLIKGEAGPQMENKKEKEKHCAHVFTNPGSQIKRNVDLKVLETALEEYERTSNYYGEYKKSLSEFKKNAPVGEYFPVYYSKVGESSYIYLSPASITREIYQKKMSGLLGKYTPCKDKAALCPACSLFGTVGKNVQGKMFNAASRVRFTDLHLKENSKAEYKRVITLKELSSPKLSNTEFYLKRPSDDAWFWTYDYYVDNRGNVKLWDAEINGRKFYWHKGEADLPENEEITERNVTVRPLKEGRLFSGKVYFEHISKAELDRLVFLINSGDDLNLEDESAIKEKAHGYKLGAAKPLGLGSIATLVKDIKIRNITSDGSVIEWKNVPYNRYEPDKNGIIDEVKKNFLWITSFNAVEDGKNIGYPTTGKPGVDGKMYVYDWFTQNHVGYSYKNEIYKKIRMPNERTQMAFDQYMIPMAVELGKTTYRNTFKNINKEVSHNILERGREKEIGESQRHQALQRQTVKFGAVWIARYKLSRAQKQKLAEKNIKVVHTVDSWPDERTLKAYARECNIVLLPSKNNDNIVAIANSLFDKVYCATKSGQWDDGWRLLKG